MRNSTTSCTCNDNAAGLILTSHADGRSSWAFTSFLIGSSANGIGRGGFAQRDFSRGDLIIAEPPLAHFIVPDRKLISGIELADILEKTIESLNDAQRTAYFALAQLPDGGIAGLPNSMEAAHGIWMTNAYPTTSGRDEGGDGQAVFEQICRLNHSCRPNTLLSWDAELGFKTCHAATDIKRGQEITVAYWDDECVGKVRSERQRLTLQRYGFSCDCAACQLKGGELQASDQRQRKVSVLMGLISRCAVGATGQGLHAHERLCESVRELVVALRDEGLPSAWAKDYLLHAAASARRCGEWAAARQWALDASYCVRDAMGGNSRAYRSFAAEHLQSVQ